MGASCVHGVTNDIQRELDRLTNKNDKSEEERLKLEQAKAARAAAHALAELHNRDVVKQLRESIQVDLKKAAVLEITFDPKPLRNRDPDFWSFTFVHLFCRGDCQEGGAMGQRTAAIYARRWAKCLLTRADFKGWRMDVEFVASVYNILLRREQIKNVELTLKRSPFSAADAHEIAKVDASDLVGAMLESGDCNTVREVLRKKKLDWKVRALFQKMQMIHRRTPGSEADKDALHNKFFAMRVWNGCSSLFFTLNPHDIRSPLTVMLVNQNAFQLKRFSLDMSDEETERYFDDLLRANPRKLHEMEPVFVDVRMFMYVHALFKMFARR